MYDKSPFIVKTLGVVVRLKDNGPGHRHPSPENPEDRLVLDMASREYTPRGLDTEAPVPQHHRK